MKPLPKGFGGPPLSPLLTPRPPRPKRSFQEATKDLLTPCPQDEGELKFTQYLGNSFSVMDAAGDLLVLHGTKTVCVETPLGCVYIEWDEAVGTISTIIRNGEAQQTVTVNGKG